MREGAQGSYQLSPTSPYSVTGIPRIMGHRHRSLLSGLCVHAYQEVKGGSVYCRIACHEKGCSLPSQDGLEHLPINNHIPPAHIQQRGI